MKYGVGRLKTPLVVLALFPALFLGSFPGLNVGLVFAQEELDREAFVQREAKESTPTELFKIPYSATARTLDGETVSLKNYEGKLVFLTVWRTDCKACMIEIPILNKLQQEFAGDDFTVIGFSVDKEKDAFVKKVVNIREINYPIWMGYGQPLSKYVETPYLPTLFTIGPKGEVLGYMIGAFQSYEHAVAVVKEARLRIAQDEGVE